ncbi:TOR complex subunit lst8 [Boothiomyces sp. JEL0866]|nr:TOR complex subunit lst8 [Boothiomyces sp. JEL0866]
MQSVLDLDHKQIDINDLQEIAVSIQANKSLVKLSLFSNHIQNEGLKVISQAIKYHPTLAKINLGYNSISDDTIPDFVTALKHSEISHIDLDENLLTPNGIKELLKVFRPPNPNYKILELQLNGNPGLETGLSEKLTEYLERNKAHYARCNQQALEIFKVARKLQLLPLPFEIKMHVLGCLQSLSFYSEKKLYTVSRVLLDRNLIGHLDTYKTFSYNELYGQSVTTIVNGLISKKFILQYENKRILNDLYTSIDNVLKGTLNGKVNLGFESINLDNFRIANIPTRSIQIVFQTVEGFQSGISSVSSGITNTIGDVQEGLSIRINGVQTGFSNTLEGVQNGFNSTLVGINSSFDGVQQGISKSVSSVQTELSKSITNTVESLQNVSVSFGKFSLTTSTLQKFNETKQVVIGNTKYLKDWFDTVDLSEVLVVTIKGGNPHIRLYDVQSTNPNPITTFEGHTKNVTAVAFQSAGRWFVTGSEDGTIKIFDVRMPGIQRDYTPDPKSPVNDVIIHPNQGELISCDQNGSIRVWDLGENSCTHELLPDEETPVRSVSIASDGSLLVAANNKGYYYAWKTRTQGDLTDFAPLTRVNAHSKYITKCVLSPDNKLLATCSADHTVKIWDASTHQFNLQKTLNGHQRWVWDCAFSADSAYLVTGSSDHSSRLWDLSSGETIRHYNGHSKAVVAVALHDVSVI